MGVTEPALSPFAQGSHAHRKGGIVECKCQYYQYKDGILVCVQCGKPAKEKPVIEDKIAERTEVKRIIPHGVNKVGRPRKLGR